MPGRVGRAPARVAVGQSPDLDLMFAPEFAGHGDLVTVTGLLAGQIGIPASGVAVALEASFGVVGEGRAVIARIGE